MTVNGYIEALRGAAEHHDKKRFVDILDEINVSEICWKAWEDLIDEAYSINSKWTDDWLEA